MKKYPCPCCGYRTLKDEPLGTYDICPVCFWEDDPLAHENPDECGECNGVSLNQAKENFRRFGACHEKMIPYTRKPTEDEWRGEAADA